ncbi:hypothetical protein [Neisseria sp. Ec49-e6-T10]|uniref:hypothetical protein n=1 Tax=Neisseria sp. Ec49-e6-T10 TaxID=3140744 RepID=UPI003EBE3D67
MMSLNNTILSIFKREKMKDFFDSNPNLRGILQIFAGLIFILWNIYSISSTYTLKTMLEKDGEHTTATLSNFKPNKILNIFCLGNQRYYSYNIQYKDKNDRLYHHNLSGCRTSRTLYSEDNSTVSIIYSFENPNKYIIYSDSDFFVKGILILIGLVLSANGVASFFGFGLALSSKKK